MFRTTELRAIPLVSIIVLLCAGCGGGQSTITTPEQQAALQPAASGLPTGLPVDTVQPWEQMDAAGHVMPAGRTASCINAGSEFCCGAERQQSSLAGVSDSGEAARLTSGDLGSGDVTWAYWRLTMGGEQPGAVSADVNLLPMSDGELSEYYLGLSEYGAGQWQWHGPYSESHLRLSTAEYIAAGSDYLSEYGNLFICVAAVGGATFDVVGVAANARDDSDTEAPPAPTGLTATPIAGGLGLEWHGAVADDLAGYRLYWRDDWFIDQQATGVKTLGWLEGHTRHMLPVSTDAPVHLRVSAVDTSGNESGCGELAIAAPLGGDAPPLQLTASAPSGMLNDTITLTATGADSYDWDLDGDGDYEVTDDTSGTQAADTSATGLIRPAVRGSIGDESCTACGSVTLLVAGNSRPVATAYASPASGTAPLSVTFSGSGADADGTIENYAWDFDGDGTYDYNSDTEPNPPVQVYSNAGLYNAKLRVTDDQDAWDVDTVAVNVLPAPDPANSPPLADLTAAPDSGDAPLAVQFDASGSSDSDGTIVEYAWDWDGNGGYEEFSDSPLISHTFTAAGSPEVKLRVEDDDGARATDTVTITVNVVGNELPVADLSPATSSGDAPHTVSFDAGGSGDPDGSIVKYEWDFEGDGVYDGYGDSETIDHTYIAAGMYTAKLRVTDDAGAQDTDTSSIDVNGPPVAELTGSAGAIDPDETIHLYATGSSDPDGTIDDYEWDFDNDGVFNETDNDEDDSQGNPSTSLTLSDAGPYTATVRVTDDDGASDTASYSFAVHGWVFFAVDTAGSVGRFTSLAVVDGCPAISYFDWTNQDLKYARATTSTGGSPSEWTQIVTIDSTGDVGEYTSLAVVDGCPAISYYDATNGDLKYARATTSTGGSASDWTQIITVDSPGDEGEDTTLAVVGGCPAISYYDATNGDLKYARATTSTGGSASEWTQIVTVDSTGDVGRDTSLAVVFACPAISYRDVTNGDLKYARATTSTGGSASDWTQIVTVDSDGNAGYYTSLAVVAGCPAISYYNATSQDLKYVRATTRAGGAASKWPQVVTVDSGWLVGYFTSLAVVAGCPAISYYDDANSDLKLARSTTALGGLATDWQTETVDGSGDVGRHTSLAVVNGCPAISYFKGNNGNLKYAIRY